MQRVWGGDTLGRLYHRQLPEQRMPVGESWELSDRPEAETIVDGGPWRGLGLHQLWRDHRCAVFGRDLEHHPSHRFPLLLKILDAREKLSLQVHPPATVASRFNGEPKDEFWFIADAAPEATIFAGLEPGIDRAALRDAIRSGNVATVVRQLQPTSGQCLSLPSGRVHALGAGLLVFEIQQNSDTTFRVFDWNRPGLDGQPRPLHVDESLECIDFDDNETRMIDPQPDQPLTHSPYFDIRLRHSPDSLGKPTASAVIVAVIEGSLVARLDPAETSRIPSHDPSVTLIAGDFCLLPADRPGTTWTAQTTSTRWLEIRLHPEA